ncbi:MAG: hypothetical protein ACTHME_05630 [Candidatus Nitrosocosmicus sp.]
MANEFNLTIEQLRELLVICQSLFNYYNKKSNDSRHNIGQLYDILFGNSKSIGPQLYLNYINWLTGPVNLSILAGANLNQP